MIFVEELNLIGPSRAMLGKHCLDASWGQLFTIKRAKKFEIWRVLSKGKRS